MNFEGMKTPEKVSMTKLKSWILGFTGVPPWLMVECQRFAGSLNEALALSLGPPVGELANESAIEAGFSAWGGMSLEERQNWVVAVLLSMEVTDRRAFMRFLGGRASNNATGIATEMISLQVCGVLLYVRELGRAARQYECTFGLLADDNGFVGCFKSMLGEGEVMDWISENLGERVGPIRAVRVSELFVLDCEGVQESSRHKAGFKATSVSVIRWDRNRSGNFSAVTRLSEVKDALPRPQDSGQIG